MRISATFSEGVLFQEPTPIFPPTNDLCALNGPAFQGAYANPLRAVDPAGVGGTSLGGAPAGWSNSTPYSVKDFVTFSGLEYVAIQAGTGHQPNTSPTFWLASPRHLYPDCYVPQGKWEIQEILVTNANSLSITWTIVKFPAGTYKNAADHGFYTYSPSGPGFALNPRAMAPLYYQPLVPGQSVLVSGLKLVAYAGESLWATASPGYISPFATPNGPISTMRISGDWVQ